MLLSLVPLAWAAMAHAIPASPPSQRQEPAPGRLTLPARVNPHYVSDGPADLVAAYRKWNMPVPEGLENHMLTRRAGYSAGLAPATATNGNSYWVSEIFIGSTAQAIPVLFDSGSSDFWLMSTDTQFGDAAKNGKPELYDPSKSSVSKEVEGAAWDLKYHDGSSTSGKVYIDNIRIGLYTDYHYFNISNATIQSAVTVSNRFAIDPKMSGVFGLAKSAPSNIEPKMPTMMERLKQDLHFEYIGADLRRDSSLGFWDLGSGRSGGSNMVNEPPMPGSEHWDVRIQRFRMSSMNDDAWYINVPFTATIDTGSSLLLLPGQIASAYYAQIPESTFDNTLQAYLFPCSLASGIPDFQFWTGGGFKGLVPSEYINLGPVPGNSEKCFGAIQNSATTRAIFGGVVLQTLYVQFNYGEKGSYVSFGQKSDLDVCDFTSRCKE